MSQTGNANGTKALVLGALGVVYGDIGTSPLYAMNECFGPHHGLVPTEHNVIGILSLFVWTLIALVTVKYVAFVLRADNDGEGGILALMALVRPKETPAPWSLGAVLVAMGLFGAALLYGDGVITPAVSVLGAVEGLPEAFHPFIVPITIAILVTLFSVQSRGTAQVGRVFGPIMLLWFVTIAALGVVNLVQNPVVLWAFAPWYGVQFLLHHGWHGFLVMGSVFLCATGGEALYADMGHFGKLPIRIAWFALVLPALLLNYFGQGALLISNPQVGNAFYGLAPAALRIPLVVLATMAAVIASQALISGAFSLTRQAIQLGYSPRMPVEHTSADEIGQIYIPFVNWTLLALCVAVVLGFKSSTALAAAYGIAVTLTMVITTALAFVLSIRSWGWSVPRAVAVWSIFLVIEASFLIANATKIADGGWLPLLLGVVIFALMTTWYRGRVILSARLRDQSIQFDVYKQVIAEDKPLRVPGTAIFMTPGLERLPPALLRNTVHNKVLHERVVLCTVQTEESPYVEREKRIAVEEMGEGFWRVVMRYGFMESPDVPRALERCKNRGLDLQLDETTFFLGRETVMPTENPGMALWRERIFAFLTTNAQSATAFYRIPPAMVIEIGAQIEI